MSHDSAKCGEEGSVISVRTLSFGFVLVWDPGRNFIYTMGVYCIHVITPNSSFLCKGSPEMFLDMRRF